MAVATDHFAQFAHRGQEAFSRAVRVWQDTLRSYPHVVPSAEALPAVYATVDATFDAAERLLADQREFTKALISVGTQTFESISKQATWFATQTSGATKDAGPEEAEAPARPADNAAQPADQTEPAPFTPVTAATAPKRPRAPRQSSDA